MTVERIRLRDFTAFQDATVELGAGLHVLLGENGVGKTHIIKAIYAALKAAEHLQQPLSVGFSELAEVFRPTGGDVERLRRIGLRGRPEQHLFMETDRYQCHCELGHVLFVNPKEPRKKPGPEPIFLPSRDVLAMYEGFAGAYQSRDLSFDKTYFDTCVALSTPPLREEPTVVGEIDGLAGGVFVEENGRFELREGAYVGERGDRTSALRVREEPNLEAHLVGEGLRRLGTLGRLLRNGRVTPGMTLLWDEPEAGLNPQLVSPLAKILIGLCAWGVQLVVTTHDYLLPRLLSLHAEYGLSPPLPIKFHGFYRPNKSMPVVVESASTLADLEHNPTFDEFTRHHEWERDLFYGSTQRETST